MQENHNFRLFTHHADIKCHTSRKLLFSVYRILDDNNRRPRFRLNYVGKYQYSEKSWQECKRTSDRKYWPDIDCSHSRKWLRAGTAHDCRTLQPFARWRVREATLENSWRNDHERANLSRIGRWAMNNKPQRATHLERFIESLDRFMHDRVSSE
jgi:hypothetical protein